MYYALNMRTIKENKIKIEIIGGIGNQLFCFFAGLYYSQRFDKQLVVDFSQVGNGTIDHGSLITSLDGINNLQHKRNSLYKISKPSKIFLDALTRRSKKIQRIRFSLKNNYVSMNLGFDPFISENSKISKLQGYFQTWRYFDGLKEPFSFNLKCPSKWYIELCQEIASIDPTVIHVRRGDYHRPQNKMGLLSQKYYEQAIRHVQTKTTNPNFWIFSDDIIEAQTLLSEIASLNTRWITPPQGSDPMESLLLMSMSQRIIIANSSYSWWAAKIGGPKDLVISPNPWFENIEQPTDLIPHTWRSIKSDWI
jgi:hypothetical protein